MFIRKILFQNAAELNLLKPSDSIDKIKNLYMADDMVCPLFSQILI